ncbi:hypothetical protein ACEWY4_019838 [Coilia grayii]|uniref:C2H2-type domain-containing protein n=1 Tax=Coilia grayii TaxID=363190 RepID=A0ABD1JAW2_9TELE
MFFHYMHSNMHALTLNGDLILFSFQLQDDVSTLHPDQWQLSEASSDSDHGLEASPDGVSSQSQVLQLLPSQRSHVCWECGEGFTTLHNLLEHFQGHKTAGRCHLCQVTFRQGTSLALHLENAHRQGSLACPFTGCGAQPRNRWHLNQHLEMCHAGKCVGAVVAVEEEVMEEEEQLTEAGQSCAPERHLQPSVVCDHAYHMPENMDQVRTDHTYNDRHKTTGPADMGQQYDTPSVNQRKHQPVASSNTQQRCMNSSAGQAKVVKVEEGFLEECAPIQWDEDEDFAEEEVGKGSETSCSTEGDESDEDFDDDDCEDGSSDSLPPGDSLYVPEHGLSSASDSGSDSETDSLSSDCSDYNSYLKSDMYMPYKKQPDTKPVVKPSPAITTSQTGRKCPHCGLGPFLDLRPHMTRCCLRGPDKCMKCWKAYGHSMDFICVVCKETFSGWASCKKHICTVNAPAVSSAQNRPASNGQPAEPKRPASCFTLTPAQFSKIVSLLPPGVIYTQAQPTIVTQTRALSSAGFTVVHNNRTVNVVSPASPLVIQNAGQVSPQVATKLPPCPSAPGGSDSTFSVVKIIVPKNKGPAGNLAIPANSNAIVPASQTAAGSEGVTPAPSQIVSSPSTQAVNQLASPPVLFRLPGPLPLPAPTALPAPRQRGAASAVLVCGQASGRAPVPSTAHNQGPVRVAAPTVACSTAPAQSMSTIAGMMFRIPGPDLSKAVFVPNHSLGATKPCVGHLVPMPSAGGKPGVVPAQLAVLPQRCPAPPPVTVSGAAGHHVSSQASSAVPSQVSVSNTVCTKTSSTSLLPPQASVTHSTTVFVSANLPPSVRPPSVKMAASAPIQAAPNAVSVTPRRPIQPAPTCSSSLSATGVPQLKILFMFLNQSRELAQEQRKRTRWHYKSIFTCRQCGAISRQPSLGVLHRYRHLVAGKRRQQGRHYRCRCGRRFQARLHLLRHQMVHAEATRYICGPCGDTFEGARQLARHKVTCLRLMERSNHLDCCKPFVCSCGLRFVRPSALLWHKLNNSRHRDGKARNTKVPCQSQPDVKHELMAT